MPSQARETEYKASWKFGQTPISKYCAIIVDMKKVIIILNLPNKSLI